MSILVIDVGTSGLRAAVVRPDGSVDALHHVRFPPSTPFPGLVDELADGAPLDHPLFPLLWSAA